MTGYKKSRTTPLLECQFLTSLALPPSAKCFRELSPYSVFGLQIAGHGLVCLYRL
jgi:hypothetical protein